MIKYLLGCASGHEFESWFRAGADFDAQSRSGEIACPYCGSIEISKQPMAPSVVTKRAKAAAQTTEAPVSAPAGGAGSSDVREALRVFTQKVIANTEDVGTRFADEARKMHFGEIEERHIRGSSTPEEARELVEDGVPFGILPTLPEDLN
ncbi:MAG: DUF1178 family protein [Hyphomicrobium sp.]|uniref:DUF1178 family protein n=1 Tax=Hyphomicrobium sp. TaxID=82 RepID=UPI0039E24ACC